MMRVSGSDSVKVSTGFIAIMVPAQHRCQGRINEI